jgi:hypothetical protein
MTHRYSNDKDLNKYVKTLIRLGWSPVKRSNNGHWQVVSPGGTSHTIAGTVSDTRTLIKFKADIQRTISRERLTDENIHSGLTV